MKGASCQVCLVSRLRPRCRTEHRFRAIAERATTGTRHPKLVTFSAARSAKIEEMTSASRCACDDGSSPNHASRLEGATTRL
jgi:hypothetical protein